MKGPAASPPTYTYEGQCQRCNAVHSLPRNAAAVQAAGALMAELREDPRFGREGQMFGVLLGRDLDHRPRILRAFSGMWEGRSWAHGFVGPTRSGRPTERHETSTLAALEELSRRIQELDPTDDRARLERTAAPWDTRIAAAIEERDARRRERRVRRAALETTDSAPENGEIARALDEESRTDRRRLKELRASRRAACAPIENAVEAALTERTRLRQERRRLSQELQARMHASHGLVSFRGDYQPIATLFPDGLVPSGAGECCAPKLLQEAALRGITPEAMAEFWWEPTPHDASGREHRRFYGACAEKCAPILGHLLCGAEAPKGALRVIHEDDALVVVDKPAGLLSVPGRRVEHRDCAETRVALLHPDQWIRAAHRLDQATSGLLVVSRSPDAHRSLGRAFAQRRVTKEYVAVVRGRVADDEGIIDLPLAADLAARPRQRVDHEGGRSARTRFVVVERTPNHTRLRLEPETGRSHQLRVHCAAGLGTPILGDELYGTVDGTENARLLLHASHLSFPHPAGGRLTLESTPPF